MLIPVILLYALIQDILGPQVDTLLGNPRKAQEKLGWTPTTSLRELYPRWLIMIYVMLKKMHFLFPKIFNTAVPLLNLI